MIFATAAAALIYIVYPRAPYIRILLKPIKTKETVQFKITSLLKVASWKLRVAEYRVGYTEAQKAVCVLRKEPREREREGTKELHCPLVAGAMAYLAV